MQKSLLSLEESLRAFAVVDIGYPKGKHEIRLQKQVGVVPEILRSLGVPNTSSLMEFYVTCDGIDLPDVDVGYVIYSLSELKTINRMKSEPNKFNGGSIVILGIDGGGGRFVVDLQSDVVYHLPPADISNDRVYQGASAKLIAQSVEGFVHALAEKTERATM